MKDNQAVDRDWQGGIIPTSQYLTAAQVICSAIEDVPQDEAGLSLSQYRILLRICECGDDIKGQKEYAGILHLKENVVSSAVTILEKQGLVVRTPSHSDKRVKLLYITDAGSEIALRVAEKINDKFEYIYIDAESWITESIEGVAAFIGSSYEGCPETPFKGKVTSERISSHIISTQLMDEGLKEKVGITITEARVIKYLGEIAEPARPVDIAYDLVLSQVTVNMMVNNAEKRNWVKRIGAQNSKRAVFVELTEQGREALAVIVSEIDRTFRRDTFSKLDEHQQKAIMAIGPHILARIHSDYQKTVRVLPLR